MMKISVTQRILAAVASITVSIGMAQGMTELARYESGSRWMKQGAAPLAGIACAPDRAARDMHKTGSTSATRARG
jgi:hypothetical protein